MFIQLAAGKCVLPYTKDAVFLMEPADHLRTQGQIETIADLIEILPYGAGRKFVFHRHQFLHHDAIFLFEIVAMNQV